jgi:CelD/BcsL family acetyltransferase involved in cellulose biosynthesis
MIDPLIEMAICRTRAQPDPHTWRLHSMLRQCARAGLAHVVMLLDGHTPVAGAAALINRKDRSLGLYLTAFDECYAQCSPGRVVISAMIRDAIDMKMRVFDFLRGEEPYKMQFGGVSRHNRTLIIERPTLQAALRRGWNACASTCAFARQRLIAALTSPYNRNTRTSTSPMPISAAPAMMPAQIGSCVSIHNRCPVDSFLSR